MEYLSHSEQETEALGASLARQLKAGDVVAYRGTWGRGRLLLPGDWPEDWAVRGE